MWSQNIYISPDHYRYFEGEVFEQITYPTFNFNAVGKYDTKQL
jgi:hypothetical protein